MSSHDAGARAGSSRGRVPASERLMRDGVLATCADCAAERVLVPVDAGPAGEFCCTVCDAAVLLVSVPRGRHRASSHAA